MKHMIFSTIPTLAASISPLELAIIVITINAIWIKPSCNATGVPTFNILRMLSLSGFSSFNEILKLRLIRFREKSETMTLTAWPQTVASAAPFAPSPNPPLNAKSRIMLTIHATATK